MLGCPGVNDGSLRRSGFNTLTRRVEVIKDMGMSGLHFHDLRARHAVDARG